MGVPVPVAKIASALLGAASLEAISGHPADVLIGGAAKTASPAVDGLANTPDSMYNQRQNVDFHTMPGIRYKQLAEHAAENFGYVTGHDARELGIPIGTLSALARRGQLDHVEHGIYRVPLVPPGRLDQYKLATLWPDGRGVISHESALDLYGISDVNPAKLHVTVPRTYRTHREVPALYVLHRGEVADMDQGSVEGIPVVSVPRAIRQAHEQHLRHSLVEQAIEDAEREGWLRRRQADDLRRELLGQTA